MDNPKFQVFKGKDNLFYFHLQAGNGEIICASQGYSSKQMCEKGIEAVKKTAAVAPVEEVA